MNVELLLTLNGDRLPALHAEARHAREARAAHPRPDRRPRLPDLLARLHLRPRPRLT